MTTSPLTFDTSTDSLVPPIVVERLRYRYTASRPGIPPVDALRGIDLVVARGECLALIGPVGAGKSTLCQALVGLVPHAWGGEFGGRVLADGLDTRAHQPAEVCRRVGIVFQDAESQLFCSTVEDEVAFAPEGLGLSRQEIERRVSWALDAVGLADCRGRAPWQLSGGQQQRLALAAALSARPRVLVLDEPAASLDPRGASDLYAVLAELRRSDELTLVVAEQDVERVAELADRVAVLDGGRIVALDAPTRVFAAGGPALGVVAAPPIGELAVRLSAAEPGLRSFVTVGEAARVLGERLGTFPPLPTSPPDTGGEERERRAGENPVIELRGLTHIYEGGHVALAGVDLVVGAGSRLALVGQNGSGKTTLAKHLIGLLRPTRGTVRVDGRDAARLSVGELAATVGYVFQNPDRQIFAPTVEEELSFGPRQLGVSEAEVHARVGETLDFLGLTVHRADPPAALGYGLRRLVGLAGVLTLRPRVLVLDEPFTGLDWRACAHVLERLREVNRQGCTVLLITHDMRVVAEFATRVVALAAGRIVADATPRELFASDESLVVAGLARPRISELAHQLRSYGLRGDSLTADELAADYLARRGSAAESRDAEPNEIERGGGNGRLR